MGLDKYFTPLAMKQMQENGISMKVLGSRLMTLSDMDEIFSFKTRGRKTKYPAWAARKAKEIGISRQTLYHRVKIQGLSIEEAISKTAK